MIKYLVRASTADQAVEIFLAANCCGWDQLSQAKDQGRRDAAAFNLVIGLISQAIHAKLHGENRVIDLVFGGENHTLCGPAPIVHLVDWVQRTKGPTLRLANFVGQDVATTDKGELILHVTARRVTFGDKLVWEASDAE